MMNVMHNSTTPVVHVNPDSRPSRPTKKRNANVGRMEGLAPRNLKPCLDAAANPPALVVPGAPVKGANPYSDEARRGGVAPVRLGSLLHDTDSESDAERDAGLNPVANALDNMTPAE